MTADIMNEDELAARSPASVAPGMLALVCGDAPTGMIMCAGAGSFEAAHITLTRGIAVEPGEDAPEQVLAGLGRILDRTGETVPETGMQQSQYELAQRAKPLVTVDG